MVHKDKRERDKGREYLDDTPVVVPVKFRGVPGEVDRVRQLMASLVVDMRERHDVESFEESLDFEVDDDDRDLSSVVSPSETRYMQEEKLLTEAREASNVLMQRRAAAEYRRKVNGTEADGKGSGARRERSDDGGKESGSERGARGRVGEDARGGSGGASGDSGSQAKG